MSALIAKSEFVGIENVTHLAAGGETPMLLSNLAAIHRFVLDKGIGMPGRGRMAAMAAKARARLAKLLGAAPQEVALLWNATAGLHAAAAGMPCRPGDNVVLAASEFPSLMSVWHGAGIEVRQVGNSRCATLDEIASSVDARTRAILVSHVSYLTGERSDLAALRAIADRHGARLIVDASHALGVVRVDGSLCDAVVSCCYKWLFGTHGVGVFFVNAKRWPDLQPITIGWNSVDEEDDLRRDTFELKPGLDRFEFGNLSFISLYCLENGIARLEEAGMPAIEAHALDLGGELRAGLVRLNLDVLTPEAPRQRAGNICFATDRWAAIEAQLRADGIVTWGDAGRLRISVHAYNDAADVARVLDALATL